jgi:quinol monooxygenase YgiN
MRPQISDMSHLIYVLDSLATGFLLPGLKGKELESVSAQRGVDTLRAARGPPGEPLGNEQRIRLRWASSFQNTHMCQRRRSHMAQKLFALMSTFILTVAWIGLSAAQQPATGQVLRVFTTTVSSDKRDQMPKIVEDITQLLTTTKSIQWFKVGSDAATGEIVAVTLWNSQAEIDAFLKSDARKALNEKNRPLMQGEPIIKQYQVSEATK